MTRWKLKLRGVRGSVVLVFNRWSTAMSVANKTLLAAPSHQKLEAIVTRVQEDEDDG